MIEPDFDVVCMVWRKRHIELMTHVATLDSEDRKPRRRDCRNQDVAAVHGPRQRAHPIGVPALERADGLPRVAAPQLDRKVGAPRREEEPRVAQRRGAGRAAARGRLRGPSKRGADSECDCRGSESG